MVRLQEDVTLAGFTPLKNNTPDPIFCRCDIDIEIAQVMNRPSAIYQQNSSTIILLNRTLFDYKNWYSLELTFSANAISRFSLKSVQVTQPTRWNI